jgi:hypothetical protein
MNRFHHFNRVQRLYMKRQSILFLALSTCALATTAPPYVVLPTSSVRHHNSHYGGDTRIECAVSCNDNNQLPGNRARYRGCSADLNGGGSLYVGATTDDDTIAANANVELQPSKLTISSLKTAGDWLILHSLRSKMRLSPFGGSAAEFAGR